MWKNFLLEEKEGEREKERMTMIYIRTMEKKTSGNVFKSGELIEE